MAEPRDVGRQESLFDALALPRARRPAGPWSAPPERDEDTPREAATVSYLHSHSPEGELVAPAEAEAPTGAASPAQSTPEANGELSTDYDAPRGAAPVVDLRVPREEAPPTNLTGPQGEAAVVFEREVAGERAPRVAGAPLAGPTLDDVMSRVWEGLVTGLPAACPVCHHEVLPVLGGPAGGRCTSCGTVID